MAGKVGHRRKRPLAQHSREDRKQVRGSWEVRLGPGGGSFGFTMGTLFLSRQSSHCSDLAVVPFLGRRWYSG